MASRPIVLFGYESSAFTWKARLALRLKQIPYTFITVESMMPRPKLREAFNLTYRRIPVLAIGRDVYCDTSIICDALEHYYPEHQSLFPKAEGKRNQSSLMRGFAAYWVAGPFYRATCAVMPSVIWRTAFGTDRGGLVGHAIDADKLEKKIPEGMWKLDQHFSMLERFFPLPSTTTSSEHRWLFGTVTPSLADVALYAQLWWCSQISQGNLMENLTAGGTKDARYPGIGTIFNEKRYPALLNWFRNFEEYIVNLPSTETKDPDWPATLESLRVASDVSLQFCLLPTANATQNEVDETAGLRTGAMVSIYPDETGRFDPTIGELVAASPEEFVIKPKRLAKASEVDVRVHFPRLGFVARPYESSKL